jgi:hypothetical protein
LLSSVLSSWCSFIEYFEEDKAFLLSIVDMIKMNKLFIQRFSSLLIIQWFSNIILRCRLWTILVL